MSAADMATGAGHVNAVSETAQGVSGNVNAAKGIMADNEIVKSMDLVSAPVAGPTFCRLLFIFVAIGVCVFGVYTVVMGGATTWREPITTITTTRVKAVDYPDIYLCLAANDVAEIFPEMENNFFVSTLSVTDSRKLCGTAATMASLNVVSGKVLTKDNHCIYEEMQCASGAAKPIGSAGAALGCEDMEDCSKKTGDVAHQVALKSSPDVDKLQSTLPIYEDGDGTEWAAACLKIPAVKDKKGLAGSDPIFMKFKFSGTANPIYHVYFTKQGVPPVNAAGEIRGGSAAYAGPGLVSVAELTLELEKDETLSTPDKTFVSQYTSNMWTKLSVKANENHGKPDLGTQDKLTMDFKESLMGISFKSLFVRKTHIRYKTFLEIYTELGGIYAASIAILAFIFVKSGYVDKKEGGKEMYIFAYLPASMRVKWLDGKSAKGAKSAEGATAPADPV